MATRKPISDLKTAFFVRKQLNQAHVQHLAELILNGAKLPPIVVSHDNEVLDGRHRLAALDALGEKDVEVEYARDTLTRVEALAFALKQNTGGALPPTPDDIRFTVRQMLEQGLGERRIADLLAFLPRSLTRRYCTDARSQILKAKMRQARTAVGGGMTVPAAAQQYGVEPEALRAEISGERKRERKDTTLATVKADLTGQYRSHTRKNAALFERTIQQLEDGEITDRVAAEIFSHAEQLIDRQHKSFREWKGRLESASQRQEAPAA